MSRKNYNIFLQQRGILSQHTCPYTPQQNGVSERKNRHLLDIVRSLLLDTSVPARFWLEALSHFCSFNLQVYLLLVLRIRLLTIVFFKSIPRILTCIHLGVYVLFFSPPSERTKLSAQSSRCAFWDLQMDRKVFFVLI